MDAVIYKDRVLSVGLNQVAVMLTKQKRTVPVKQIIPVPPTVIVLDIYQDPPIWVPIKSKQVEPVDADGELVPQPVYGRCVQARPVTDYESSQASTRIFSNNRYVPSAPAA